MGVPEILDGNYKTSPEGPDGRIAYVHVWEMQAGVPHLNSYNLHIAQSFNSLYRGADKSLARLGRKQATATEVFEFHVSYL